MEAQRNYLKYTLIALTGVLVILQFYLLSFKVPFQIGANNKNLGFFAIFANKLAHSFSLWLPLIAFLLAQLFLQILLTALIYFVITQFISLHPKFKKHIYTIGILFWAYCQLLIFIWNCYLYPYSFFAIKLSLLQSHPAFFLSALSIMTAIPALILIIALIASFKNKPKLFIAIFAICLILSTIYLSYKHFYLNRTFAALTKPNVILVITDSLRPDFATNKNSGGQNLPHIEKIIRQSAFFSNSFTLLGRSTPGLVTMLTGNYPKVNGARFNLTPSNHLHLENSLTKTLKQHGYQTALLIDGIQFTFIDSKYNFDQVIAPKSGIYDFIFSFINDTPLSNLVGNTALGRLIFPYTYGNRNTYFSYLPNSFINLADAKLINKQPSKPLFLVAALTVAHWPYVWARQPNLSTIEDRYINSVMQLDHQFAELFKLLGRRGVLKNSLVIIASDHGDSLGLPGDRIISPQNLQGAKERLYLIPHSSYTKHSQSNSHLTGIDTSAGHGTDLLSMTQLHTTLGIYYPRAIKPQTIDQRVALIDLAPTILDLLNIKSTTPFQGVSLKPLMMGNKDETSFNRPLFLETEIDIPLIDVLQSESNHSAVSKLVEQYAKLYEINLPTQQLFLRNKAINSLLQEKQLGIMEGDWLLAYFPGKNTLDTRVQYPDLKTAKECYYIFPATKEGSKVTQLFCYFLHPTVPYYVLANLKTNSWQILFNNETETNPIFKELVGKLRAFYRNELP